MTIEPDGKDWTWVLRERCPECGLTAAAVEPSTVAALLRESVPRWRAALDRDDAGSRPRPTTWSTLEYACHVRDVCDVFAERVQLMTTRDDPAFDNWDQDKTADESNYGAQDASVVADELEVAAHRLAGLFDAVDGAQWQRTGRRSNGSTFTVATLAQYFWHDVAHHLHDVNA